VRLVWNTRWFMRPMRLPGTCRRGRTQRGLGSSGHAAEGGAGHRVIGARVHWYTMSNIAGKAPPGGA
jgi:hypothetical protein